MIEHLNKLNLPNELRLLVADVLPLDSPNHAGCHVVQLQAASGATAWGFGRSYGDAAADAREALKEGPEIVLQIWKSTSGQYSGRFLDGGTETARVAGCATTDEVEAQAAEAGIFFHRVEILDGVPPVL